jgi:hypothetical protein
MIARLRRELRIQVATSAFLAVGGYGTAGPQG